MYGRDGENAPVSTCCRFEESGCLGVQPKIGGKSHLKLNTGERPIANKYREGKMQRTLKRELKVLEIVKREAIGSSHCSVPIQVGARVVRLLRGEGSSVASAGR